MEATWIYILAAFSIGFLFGMVLEAFIDNKAIREQAEINRRLREKNRRLLDEIAQAPKNEPAQVHILDHRGIEADELFKTF